MCLLQQTFIVSISPPVMFAYEQCLLVLGHHPDIWYEAAQYLEQSSKLLAEKGVKNIPSLTFYLLCVFVCVSFHFK